MRKLTAAFKSRSVGLSIPGIPGSYLIVLLLFFSAGVQASPLDDAKANSLIGELSTGYVGPVNSGPDAATQTLVRETNGKRRAQYQRIAKANGLSIADVERLAAKKAFERSRPGSYIKPPGSDWKKK